MTRLYLSESAEHSEVHFGTGIQKTSQLSFFLNHPTSPPPRPLLLLDCKLIFFENKKSFTGLNESRGDVNGNPRKFYCSFFSL